MIGVIPILPKHYSDLAKINETIKTLEEKRNFILEVYVGTSEVKDKEIHISKITPAGIEYSIDDPPEKKD